MVALGAVRRFPDDRHPERHAVGNDIQKAADAGADKAEPEGGYQVDYCVGGHVGIRFGRLCKSALPLTMRRLSVGVCKGSIINDLGSKEIAKMNLLVAVRHFFLLGLFVAVVFAKPLAAVGGENGFEPLLGGNAPQLWRGYAEEGWPKGWSLENGVLARVAGGGDIMTVEKYADFELRLDWKISPGGNSGILYRISTGDKAPYVTGIEYQILDDDKHANGKDLLTCAGSLYAMYARSELVTKPVGEWNETKIIVQGNRIEHWLNGKKVVACEIDSDNWNKRLAISKFADWPKFAKNREGHISLQDHHDPVWYRNIRIKRLIEKK